jgi:hypothetical protein
MNHKTDYQNGETLSAAAWNALAADVNELVAGGVNSGSGSSEYLSLSTKNNVELTSPKNINIEPASDSTNNVYGDISLKPGDDIEFLSSHRPSDKQDEISLKVHNDDKEPVKLQINASEFVLSTKDKVGSDSNVLDVTVNSAKNTRGYLKVRAQAIDLRCEDHGGIAIQPKGEDAQHHMNKIKFEHGGGDGLEFGTFNTEHTSLFTEDYRFNKDGVIRLATRDKIYSDKVDGTITLTYLGITGENGVGSADSTYDYSDNDGVDVLYTPGSVVEALRANTEYTIDQVISKFFHINIALFKTWLVSNAYTTGDTIGIGSAGAEENTVGNYHVFQIAINVNDNTTKYKYQKQSDDTYDKVDVSDPTCTWEDIVKFVAWAKTNNQGPWEPQL